jgi:hypothetical protein
MDDSNVTIAEGRISICEDSVSIHPDYSTFLGDRQRERFATTLQPQSTECTLKRKHYNFFLKCHFKIMKLDLGQYPPISTILYLIFYALAKYQGNPSPPCIIQ